MTEQNIQHSRSSRFFLKIAGRRLRAYSIVTHIGRRSACEYQNPVGAYPLGDGFVIAILYGPESQWVRNVMASGGFTLRTKGRDYQLERPEVIPSSQALAATRACGNGPSSYEGSTSSCGHTAARTPRLRPLAGDTSRGAPRAEEQT